MSILDTLLDYADITGFVLSLLVIYLLNKIIVLGIERSTKSQNIPPDMGNAIIVVLRFGIALLIIYSAVIFLDIGGSTILGLSVFLGSIISFASIYTIQNFVSGLYILITEPFSVNDMVKIGDSEGVVVEITLNYTKILNFDGMVESIPNKKTLSSVIINFDQRVEEKIDDDNDHDLFEKLKKQFDDTEVTKYSFVWGAPLIDLSIMKQKIEEVCDKYTSVFGYRPEYTPYTINHRFEFSFILSSDDPMTILKNRTNFLDEISLQFH
ncbi:MAG: mechanosensitive ion channel domain-containing protein [Candidatus Kariarchaeaceae archaeon]|jgi:hypothetical protein